MCGRYTLHKTAEELSRRFDVSLTDDIFPENYNVAPGQVMPVITQDESGRKLEFMKWGFVPHWAKNPNVGYRLINARDDTIFEKPTWKSAVLRRRALIPADGFYEWKQLSTSSSQKQPFYIYPKQHKLFAFAGVWSVWRDAADRELKTFSIITTKPNREMKTIHDRMPVILQRNDEPTWTNHLYTSRQHIESLLHPYADESLEIFAVSKDVNTTQNNDSHLILPITS